MPFLIEHITEVVVAILLAVFFGTGALVALAITRRQRREKYFQRIDDLRERYSPIIAALLAQKIEYERGRDLLKAISGLDRMFILEQLLLEKAPKPAQVPILCQLAKDLGLVEAWQRYVAGRFDVATLRDALSRPEGLLQRIGRLSFLLKAKSAENLGLIRHQESWPLLAKALGDSHADVQGVAARSLALIGEPESLPALIERLHAVVLTSSTQLSLRAVKSAIVSFPLKQAPALLLSLQHSHRRIRFLAVDIIREMAEREAALDEEYALDPKVFPASLADLFLTQFCFDDNPDVRARAAPVVAFLADPRSTPVLVTLLDDPQWFVRLHTIRALAKRKFLPQAETIAQHLTDPNWMVREATARTLLVFGRVGVGLLCEHFLETSDRYSREQIADEIQRAGLIPTLLAQYGGSADGSQEALVFQGFADMGKTSYLIATLIGSPDRNLRKKFLSQFGRHQDSQIREWVKQLVKQETDPELRELAEQSVATPSS